MFGGSKDAYAFGRALGSGRFGKVYEAKERRSGDVVAIKVLNKDALLREKCVKQVRREVEIQSRLAHPNIARVLDYFHDAKHAYVVVEFCGGGSLFDRLQASPQSRLPEDQARHAVASVASAVRYCHTRHVLHRDVKPENILVDDTGALKLADFGWSVHAPPPFAARRTLAGTPEYLAPELARALEAVETGTGRGGGAGAAAAAARSYGVGADMWAVGCLAYELLTGATPFSDAAWEWTPEGVAFLEAHSKAAGKQRQAAAASRLSRGTRRPQLPQRPPLTRRIQTGTFAFPSHLDISSEAVSFVHGLVAVDAAARMTASQACAHPWIADVVASSDETSRAVVEASEATPATTSSSSSSTSSSSSSSSASASTSLSSRQPSSTSRMRMVTPSVTGGKPAKTASSTASVAAASSGSTAARSRPSSGWSRPLTRARPRVYLGKAVRVAPGTQAEGVDGI